MDKVVVSKSAALKKPGSSGQISRDAEMHSPLLNILSSVSYPITVDV